MADSSLGCLLWWEGAETEAETNGMEIDQVDEKPSADDIVDAIAMSTENGAMEDIKVAANVDSDVDVKPA